MTKESLEQRALRIWLNCNGETNHSNKAKIVKFARRLMAEQGEPVANQCDGCMRGLPVDSDGIHRDNGHYAMVCQKARYASPPSDALDAKRYRWLRERGNYVADYIAHYSISLPGIWRWETLDAAIDAAMEKSHDAP